MFSGFNDTNSADWGTLFDQLKTKEGLTSDAKLAESLGISRSFICSVRKSRKNLSPELGEAIFSRLGKRVGVEDLPIFLPKRVQAKGPQQTETQKVRMEVSLRAKGICELCGNPAPFLTNSGSPYLEFLVIVPEPKGHYTPDNVVALCPNCHRKMEICPQESEVEQLIRGASR